MIEDEYPPIEHYLTLRVERSWADHGPAHTYSRAYGVDNLAYEWGD